MNTTARMVGAMIVAAGIHATVAGAQSAVGRWDGTATTQQGAQSISIQLDSAAEGWKGSATSDAGGTTPLFGITVKGDTVTFSLSVQGTDVGLQGTMSGDRKTMNGYIWIQGNEAGSFKVTHAAPAKPPTSSTR